MFIATEPPGRHPSSVRSFGWFHSTADRIRIAGVVRTPANPTPGHRLLITGH
jgi:hypothetical protein